MVDIRLARRATSPDPVNSGDVANKNYVDLAISPLLPPPSGPFVDLAAALGPYTANINAGQAYREPTSTEAADAVLGITRLGIAGADAFSLLAPLGFAVSTGHDAATKRPYAMAYNDGGSDRAWGAYLMDLAGPTRMLIEAPHPVADELSEVLALEHWRATPGCLLMIAGAHRNAAGGLADVAHQTGSLFHQVAAWYAALRVPQIQWHGFADASAPGLTHVVSAGAAAVGTSIERVSAELSAAGFAVGNGWDSTGSGTGLTATTNVQGIDAAANNATFVHLENNATVRADAGARALTVAAVVAAQMEQLAYADGGAQLAQPVSGQFPRNVGSVNTVGTSTLAARADHIHAERQATLDRITALEGVSPPTEPSDAAHYGDVISVLRRDRVTNSVSLSNGYYTRSTMVARRSLTATKIRFFVSAAGTDGGSAAFTLDVYGGSDPTSMPKLSTVPVSASTLTVLGEKEFTLATPIIVVAGNRYSFLSYVAPSSYSAAPGLGCSAVSYASLLNPSATQTFQSYKAALVAPGSPLNFADGSWTADNKIIWWALL